MKFFIAIALLVAAAAAAPPTDIGRDAIITKYESDNIGTGPYQYGYQTSNGINAQEIGQLANVGSENEALQVRGSFSYTGPDNVVYTVDYVADENGFRASGAHIPQA